MKRRDSGAVTDVELAALEVRLIHRWTQALTRGARSSVPAVVYCLDSRDRRDLRDAYQHMDADEDMSEETLTQRMNDALRMQKRLHSILR